MQIMKTILIFIMVAVLSACSLSIQTHGSVVKLKGGAASEPLLAEQVELFIEVPEEAHDVVALVQASANVMDYSFIAEYEAAVLTELRQQAASIGAAGIVNITREVVSDGAVLITDTYGTGWFVHDKHGELLHHQHALPAQHLTRSTKLSQNYAIYVRGQAIIFKQ